MSDEVVGLGAWCDLVPEPRAGAGPGSVSFDVAEFALLAGGRRLTLRHGELGFSVSGARPGAGTPLGDLTAQSIEADVLTTVLPDDDDGEQHPWEWLARLLGRQGVVVQPDDLRSLPYTVEYGDRLRRLLA